MAVPYFDFSDAVAIKPQSSFYRLHGKRLVDLALLLILAPAAFFFTGLAVLIVAVTGGKPLYAQTRIGLEGKRFRCWKIRTMIPNADAVLLELLRSDPKLAEEWLKTQKLRKDPRVTRFGAILRRTSLDELPQLWNVLRGDMSLVGPRPFLPEQQGLYLTGSRNAGYYRVRPGITGLWQVSRRNRGSFAERVELDQMYYNELSPKNDMLILCKTVGAVCRATGL